MIKKKLLYSNTDFGPVPAGYVVSLGWGAADFIIRSVIEPISGAQSFAPGNNPPPVFLPHQNKYAYVIRANRQWEPKWGQFR
jgi:hypothetical protein